MVASINALVISNMQIVSTRMLALLLMSTVTGAFAISANATEPATCNRDGLLVMLRGAAELDAPPTMASESERWIARVVLHDSPLVMDGYKYDGVIDVAGKQAWMVQYGGIAGHVRWFGPVVVDPQSFMGCIEMRFGENPGVSQNFNSTDKRQSF